MEKEESIEKNVDNSPTAEKVEGESLDVEKENQGAQARKMKSLNISEDDPNLDNDKGQDDLNDKMDESQKLEPETQEETNQTAEEILGEEEAEPVFDGTEIPGMEANRSTSTRSLDLDPETQVNAWPEKAVALKNFVREKSVVAVSSVLRRLSGKKDEDGQDVSDDEHKKDNDGCSPKEVADSTKESEAKEVSQKTVERFVWNPLSYIGISHEADAENKAEHREEAIEEATQSIAMKGRIILYTRLGCQDCKEARLFLHWKRLRYVEINIDVYPSRKLELEKISGSSAVPKVFFNEVLIGGLSELKGLDESGKLVEKIDYLITEVPSIEAPLPPLSGEADMSSSGAIDELAVVVQKMRESIVIKDRFYKMRRLVKKLEDLSNRPIILWIPSCCMCIMPHDISRMLIEGFSPNEFTVCSVLKACGEENALKFGRQLHGAIVKKIFKDDVFIGTSLVGMYSKRGEILDSRKVFDGMRKRNTVTWTSIIAGYARSGLGEEAIVLFRVMKRRKIFANNLTVVSILRACGSIGALLMAKEVHAQIVKNSMQSNIHIGSTLVWFYCKCGDYSCSSKVLQQMPLRDVVSWTAIISGCTHLGHESEALEFLKEMLGEGVEPNPYTYSSALKACAKLEAILQGKSIHSSVNKTPASSNVFVGSALINMFAKCGYISEAIQVFDSMPERNLVSWKSMIVGYAKNGLCQEALQLMYRMQAEGIEVDDYILTTVLSACGDVEWNMVPSSEYCLQSS